MINDMKALSMAEASKHIASEELGAFVKQFSKLKASDAEKMRAEIEKLDNIKVKSEHISKIIDILPEDSQDIAKIFNETSLEENETTQILDIVKKYR